MTVQVCTSIKDIDAAAWNRFCADDPFINWRFLAALEETGAASSLQGWQANHLVLKQGETLRGAMPCYIKTHSHGDFVYDWGWARAVSQAGLSWYPKLVAAVPYSPVTGVRLLHEEDEDTDAAAQLARALIEQCRQRQFLTAQVNFSTTGDMAVLSEQGFMVRRDWHQFHWHNRDYQCFDDFLAALRHKKRKLIRQERRKVARNQLSFRWLDASEVSADMHQFVYHCYAKTFITYGNIPVLNETFFGLLGRQQPGRLLYCVADKAGHDVAVAVFLRSDDCLYGRYWGCLNEFPALHFEACYYQGIEYCIQHGLKRFEPGVQGEHKVSRGFLPAPSWSCHYFNNEHVAKAARMWLSQEQDWMMRYREQINEHSPYHPEITHDLLALTQP